MHNKEIQYFTEGLSLARDEFYLDTIHKFNMLVDEFPQSDLADDALYNVGLCYFKLKQFEQAKEIIDTLKTFDQNSYLVLNSKKIIFKKIATETLNTK